MSSKKRSIALVVPGLSLGGGVPAVATFLYHATDQSGRYTPDIISLAMSSSDGSSIRLLAPLSWVNEVQVTPGEWQGLPYRHVGAVLSEFEFQRYRPRRVLTTMLNQYDLVQVVAGAPAWALTTANAHPPVCLFTATLIQPERVSINQRLTGLRKYWRLAMTYIGARLEQQALSHVDYVFAESDYTLGLLRTKINPERLGLGVPGVDTQLFRPATAYGNEDYILTVGRFSDPRKNVRLLFEAYHLLRQARPQAPRLVLAGSSGPSSEDWAYAVSLGLANHVEVHEAVSTERLRELYQQASLFVLSSDEEGLGIVILEAMASGLPVVSTDCGGPATAVVEGETGFLTPVSEAKALAEAMQHLLDSLALRRRMGQAGRQRAEARFSIEAAGKVYLEKYDELVEKSV